MTNTPDPLDTLYDAACDLLQHAFKVENTDKDVEWGISQEFASHALETVRIWLQRREADRQYELQQRSGPQPAKVSVGDWRAGRGGTGFDWKLDMNQWTEAQWRFHHASWRKETRCYISSCLLHKDHKGDHAYLNPDVPAQDSP